LLGAGEYRDRLDQFGIRWQGAVGGSVGAQDVGQHERVTGVGLLAGHRVAVAVAVHRLRVDRVHRASGGPQAGHQQTPVGLNGHWDRVLGVVSGVGE
jgi:hypothetical protein